MTFNTRLYNLKNLSSIPGQLKVASAKPHLYLSSNRIEALFGRFSKFYNTSKKSLITFVEKSKFPKIYPPQFLQLNWAKTLKPSKLYITHLDISKIFNVLYPFLGTTTGVCYGIAYLAKNCILREELNELDKKLLKLNAFINAQPKDATYRELAQVIQNDKDPSNLNFFKDLSNQYRYKILLNKETQIGSFSGCYNKVQLQRHLESFEFLANKLNSKSPIALITSDINHTISLGYNPIRKTWDLVDANLVTSVRDKNAEQLTDLIFEAFKEKDSIIIGSIVSCLADSKEFKHNEERFKTWQDSIEYKNTHSLKDKSLKEKNTWLCLAAFNDDSKAVRQLIEFGANINYDCNQEFYPLNLAAGSGSANALVKLIQLKANVNKINERGISSIYAASQYGHLTNVQNLIEAGANVNQATEEGVTPLFIASQNGHLAIVQKLIEAGANINKAKEDGATPLFVASQNGHLAIVQKLIEAGANINQATQQGATPLLIASLRKHLAIVQNLIEAGANVNQATEDGTTPLLIALQNRHLKVVEFLINSKSSKNNKKIPSKQA